MSTLPAPIRAALAPFAPALFGASFDAPDKEWPDIDIFEELAWRDPAPAPAPVVAPVIDADDDEALLAQGKEWELYHSQGCEFDKAPVLPSVTFAQSALLVQALKLAVDAAPSSMPVADFLTIIRAKGLALSLMDGVSRSPSWPFGSSV